jgi:hypothetical protein
LSHLMSVESAVRRSKTHAKARMDPLNVGNEPLYRLAMRVRLEIEAQIVARGAPDAPGLALQAVGLLLQLEGLDRYARSQAPVIDACANVLPLRRPPG